MSTDFVEDYRKQLRMLDGAQFAPDPDVRIDVGVAYDILLANRAKAEQVIRSVRPLAEQVKTARRACVVTSLRNEAPYIVEWVAHYRALGFDSLIVYSNDCADQSELILEQLHALGLIRHIRNTCQPQISPQLKSFKHAASLNPFVREHEWVLFCDLDEFLVLNDDLETITNLEADCISFNWNMFISRENYGFDENPVTSRFQRFEKHDQYKSMSRTASIRGLGSAHFPHLKEGARRINGDGEEPALRERLNEMAFADRLGAINHYSWKSFAEFAALKKARGRGTRGVGGEKRSYSFFFRGNEGGRHAFDVDRFAPTWAEMSRLLEHPRLRELHDSAIADAGARIAELDRARDLDYVYRTFRQINDLKSAKRWAKAETLLKDAFGRNPDDSSMLVELAHLADVRGDVAKALSRYARLRREFPREVPRDIAQRVERLKTLSQAPSS